MSIRLSPNNREVLSAISTITGKQEYLTSTNGVLNTTGSGGGGGGAVTIADGADIAQGSIADASVTAGSAGTISGKLRQISADISTSNGLRSTSANQTNGNQQTKITDGTNLVAVNVVSGKNGLYISSNSATGAAVPANAFYLGVGNGGNLQGVTNQSADAASGASFIGTTAGVYNATTWDRIRSATAAANTTGTGLLGVGNLVFDGTNWQAQATNVSDGTSSGTSIGTKQMSYNGTTFDRNRNNVTGVVIAAGATASNAGVTTTTYNASKAVIIVNIASATAATLTVSINGVTSSGYVYPILTSTALATVAVTPLRIFPGVTPSANAAANDLVPRALQVVTTVTGTISYGIDYELSV